MNEINVLLKDIEKRHSDFQIENFIIRKQGDLWAQYKQCLREISGRNESIENEELKVKNEKINRDRIKKSLRYKLWRFLNRKKIVGDGLPPERSKEQAENVKNLKAELKCFLKIARKLKEQIGELTDGRRDELESASWRAKGLKLAAIDILSVGRISNQTLDFILSLSKENQIIVFEQLSRGGPWQALGFSESEIIMITGKTKENRGRKVSDFPRQHVR